jgi:hypothetical protein
MTAGFFMAKFFSRCIALPLHTSETLPICNDEPIDAAPATA